MDEAPMLYIGEESVPGSSASGCGCDPLEGTNIVAKSSTGLSPCWRLHRATLLHAPDMYMDKIAVGPECKGRVSLDASVKENLKEVARVLDRLLCELTVVVLDRPRHQELIEEIRRVGARIKLISDGDVSPAVAAAYPDSGVDILMGIGGAPEGVISAAALRCLGGDFQGRLWPTDEEEVQRAHQMGITDAITHILWMSWPNQMM